MGMGREGRKKSREERKEGEVSRRRFSSLTTKQTSSNCMKGTTIEQPANPATANEIFFFMDAEDNIH